MIVEKANGYRRQWVLGFIFYFSLWQTSLSSSISIQCNMNRNQCIPNSSYQRRRGEKKKLTTTRRNSDRFIHLFRRPSGLGTNTFRFSDDWCIWSELWFICWLLDTAALIATRTLSPTAISARTNDFRAKMPILTVWRAMPTICFLCSNRDPENCRNMNRNSRMVRCSDPKWMWNGCSISQSRAFVFPFKSKEKGFFILYFYGIWMLAAGCGLREYLFVVLQILFRMKRSQMSSLVCNAYITLYTPFNAWHHVHHIHIFCLCYAIESIFLSWSLPRFVYYWCFFLCFVFLFIPFLCQAKASNRNEWFHVFYRNRNICSRFNRRPVLRIRI